MAVSQRIRYEILRRDNFTCRYCRSTENPLTVDHVMPSSLGGTDEPENLVAACKDCNAGKSSSSPDSTMVAEVSEDAMRWAQAQKVAAQQIRDEQRDVREQIAPLIRDWESWDKDLSLLPADAAERISRWLASGLSMADVMEAYEIAVTNRYVKAGSVFAYMTGVINRKFQELNQRTALVLAQMSGVPDGP